MCAYVTVRLFIVVWLQLIVRKHINEHRVVHDYGLGTMVKAAQVGDLNVNANLVYKLVACHQHQRELV